MLTIENTEEFTQKQLDQMNIEAKHIRSYQNPCDLTESGLKWAEEEVLKMYRRS